MLVLSRHRDEAIVIGGNIRITVVAIRGDKVRIGIDAPPEVLIVRGELEPRNAKANPKASEAGPTGGQVEKGPDSESGPVRVVPEEEAA